MRAAVLIGVDRTGDLPVLKAAAAGAREMAAWLSAEGFEVTVITDENGGRVTVQSLKEAVAGYVRRGTVQQLVIFFAGHGYLNGTSSEIWLLSDAPQDPDAAIDMTVDVEFARESSIPSVIFVSDACRLPPNRFEGHRVRGSAIFPNLQSSGDVDVEVDRFFATRPGEAALELPDADAKQYVGLFTRKLCEAHHNPQNDLILTLQENGAEKVVVPSRSLKKFLPDLVNEAAQVQNIRLKQKPQLRLECGAQTYIGRALYPQPPAPAAAAEGRQWNEQPAQPARDHVEPAVKPKAGPVFVESMLPDDLRPAEEFIQIRALPQLRAAAAPRRRPQRESAEAVRRKESKVRYRELALDLGLDLEELRQARVDFAFDLVENVDDAANNDDAPVIRATKGNIAWAYSVEGKQELTIEPDDGQGAGGVVRMPGDLAKHPGTVLIRFHNGTGTVVAILPHYSTFVTISRGRVVNVGYTMLATHPLYRDLVGERASAATLRALAAAATRKGVLAVNKVDASKFADVIRQRKLIDPTLGLYAALAYANLGMRTSIESVQDFIRMEQKVDVFDIAVLGRIRPDEKYPQVPFCPQLTQTWSFLTPRGVTLPNVLLEAGRHLLPALWTTFDARGIRLLCDAAHSSELNMTTTEGTHR